MDARSIATTAANHGILTPATDYADDYVVPDYNYNDAAYRARVYQGFGKATEEEKIIYGPNIKDWPVMEPLADNILLKVCSKILDSVTTTDELIPSGETSTYRSNPLGMAQFTLSRRDPAYVGLAKETMLVEKQRLSEPDVLNSDNAMQKVLQKINSIASNEQVTYKDIEIGSTIYCVKPGDGSAREQAASCQRVLGGLGNICNEYATKRYRSNIINWGMVPFQMRGEPEFAVGDYIYIPQIKKALAKDMEHIKGFVLGDIIQEIEFYIAELTETEKAIIHSGSLINFSKAQKK